MTAAPQVVVDTSVVSIIYNHDDRAPYYERRLVGRHSLISFQTLEELWFGTYKNNWGERRQARLAEHLNQYICARLRSERRSVGRELKSADAWIAATAILMDCPPAAHDGDFSDIPGLKLIRSA